MKPIDLTFRQALAHLDAVLKMPPPDTSESATFRERIVALRETLARLQEKQGATALLTLADFHESILPGLKGDSLRTTLAKFRRELTQAADSLGHTFSLIKASARGKSAEQVILHFQGTPLSNHGALDELQKNASAGLARMDLIEAEAAFMSNEVFQKVALSGRRADGTKRQLVKIFLSYAHKNDALVDRLMDSLRDQLALSDDYLYEIWTDTRILVGDEWHQDIQAHLRDCDLCLAFLSPAYYASSYIEENELPPLVEGKVKCVPALVEPVDFQYLKGLEKFQVYGFDNEKKAYSELRKPRSDQFTKEVAEQIFQQTPAALEQHGRAIMQALVADSERWQTFLKEDPELAEMILAESKGEESKKVEPTRDSPTKSKLNRLLRHLSPQLGKMKLLDPDMVETQLEKTDSAVRESSTLHHNRQKAVARLKRWFLSEESTPFAAVFGELGAGKTTMLQMLAENIRADVSAPPVILVDFRDFSKTGSPTLEDILEEHLRRYDTKHELTVEGLFEAVAKENALIVFDGLDERITSLTEDARRNFIRELWRIMPPALMDEPASSGRGKIIFSCRSHFFADVQSQSSGYLAQDRAHVHAKDYLACVMLPWTDDMIRDYLAKSLGEEKVAMALELIETIHNLKDLAKRPYLLHLIGPELDELERDRAEGRRINASALYSKFINRWLSRDDGKHVFSKAHKLRLMEQMAADLWGDEISRREWTWDRVEEWLENFLYEHPAMAKTLEKYDVSVLQQDFRTATFFLRPDESADSFRFAHTSLQEYFLACHLVRALMDKDANAASAWDLVEPSRETFDFLGQLLENKSEREKAHCLKEIKKLLGESILPIMVRRNALWYFLIGVEREHPVPDRPNLAMQEMDLEGWEFLGTEERPMELGWIDFRNALLLRGRFEFVKISAQSSFVGADLRSCDFVECSLSNVDFSDSKTAGTFLRKSNFEEANITQCDFSKSSIHDCIGLDRFSNIPPNKRRKKTTLEYQIGHSSWITTVAFSSNRKWIASGAEDRSVKLWDTQTGRCLRTLVAHSGSVRSVTFSPDGKLIASGADDQSVILWSTITGKCVHILREHSNRVRAVAFSPDGKSIISGGDDWSVKLWDTRTGRCVRTYRGNSGRITSLTFSPDGKLIAAGESSNSVRLWETASGKKINILTSDVIKSEVKSLGFSPDGKSIVSGSEDHSIKLWDIESAQCVRVFSGHLEEVTSVDFSPDGKWIASGSDDNSLKLWEVESGRCVGTIRGHFGIHTKVAFSSNGKWIVSSGDDSSVKLWEAKTGRCLRTFPANFETLENIDLSPNGKRIISWHGLDGLRCWSIEGKELPVPGGASQWSNRQQEIKAVSSPDQARIQICNGEIFVREILPLEDGGSIVREPWDEDEGRKPYHEIRWKIVRGPRDYWRYCVAIDPETLEIHPPESAMDDDFRIWGEE